HGRPVFAVAPFDRRRPAGGREVGAGAGPRHAGGIPRGLPAPAGPRGLEAAPGAAAARVQPRDRRRGRPSDLIDRELAAPNINVADRDYFRNARTARDGQLSASVLINNRVDGRPTVVFSRRLETGSRKFAGVVFASVDAKYFEAIYEAAQSVDNLIFSL